MKLLVALAVVVALAVAVALVPLRGATVLERWAVAPSAEAFAARGWRDLKLGLGLEKDKAPARASAARPQRQAARTSRPTEAHTDADRAALDRIVAERARP